MLTCSCSWPVQNVLNPIADAIAVYPEFCERYSKVFVLGFLIVWSNKFEVVDAMQQVIYTDTN